MGVTKTRGVGIGEDVKLNLTPVMTPWTDAGLSESFEVDG